MSSSSSTSAPEHLAGGKPAASHDFILERRHRLACRHRPHQGRVLLDFGCGTGTQTRLFRDTANLIAGLDVDRSFLSEFARSSPREDDHQWCALPYDGLRVPLRNASVDTIVSFEVLEHVEDETQALAEMVRVLRPDGRLVMSVPNRWWVFETHGARLPLLPWNRVPFFSWLPKSIHDRYAHARIYRRREIVKKLTSAGFTVEHSSYITAPMDVIRWGWLRRVARSTLFSTDETPLPFLATAVFVVARPT